MTMTVLFIFVPILVMILLVLNLLLAVHKPDTEKVTPYECGFNPIYGQVRAPSTPPLAKILMLSKFVRPVYA